MRVLLASSEIAFARQIAQRLAATQIVIDHAATGDDALELARHYDYDLLLLTGLSDVPGPEVVVRRIRAAQIDTPAIVLSDAANPQERIRSLTAGADDVVSSAVDTEELLARMRAVVRRNKGFSQSVLSVGALQLDINSRQAAVHDRPISLTGKEFGILELLMLRKGMTLTKDAFLSHLYGGIDEPEGKIIDVFVCKLRKKLADAGARDVISTVWGRGYTVREPARTPRFSSADMVLGAPNATRVVAGSAIA
jgi:two-component system cell cycle response regulator CtrA